MTAAAVAELLAYGYRLNESQTKASAQLGLIAEVASEAAHRARQNGEEIVDVRRRGFRFIALADDNF